MSKEVQKIEISQRTIIFTLILGLSLWLLWFIRDLILLLFVSVALMSALNPLIARLQKHRFPRWLAIAFVYLGFVLGFAFLIWGIVPPLVSQTRDLVNALPSYLEKIKFMGITPEYLSSQFKLLENLPSEIIKLVITLLSNVIVILVVFVVTLYLLIEHQNAAHYSFLLFGEKNNKKALQVLSLLEQRLGHWVGAQFLLMLVIGVLSYLGYAVLDLRYALPLALLAGLMEVIPNIGPTVTAIFATLAGLTISPLAAFAAFAWGIIIQQLENNFIVPKIMKEAVGINPLITIFSLAIGFKLAGILGALLAIPVYLTIEVLLTAFFTENIPPTGKKSGS